MPTVDALAAVLTEARDHGFLGPAPISSHLDQAAAFGAAIGPAPTEGGIAVDLGSGAGLPGLVLAAGGPGGWRWALIEANQRRARFLVRSATALGVDVVVEARRAEEVGRDPQWRGTAALVVARAFGPPMVVAECAAPLLEVGAALVVSEPPAGDEPDRWPGPALARVGMAPAERVTGVGDFGFARMAQTALCPDRFPRRVGVPARRPLT